MEKTPIKMGVIAELTGPLSFMGIADANVCKMLVEDINEAGGLLGRPIELIIEDGKTEDAAAKAAAAKLVDKDKVDLVVGGIYSSTREAIRGEVTERAKTLYLYPEQYEGQEDDPLIFCTGPVPAQQVESKDYNRRFPGSAMFTAGSGCSGHYKALVGTAHQAEAVHCKPGDRRTSDSSVRSLHSWVSCRYSHFANRVCPRTAILLRTDLSAFLLVGFALVARCHARRHRQRGAGRGTGVKV